MTQDIRKIGKVSKPKESAHSPSEMKISLILGKKSTKTKNKILSLGVISQEN